MPFFEVLIFNYTLDLMITPKYEDFIKLCYTRNLKAAECAVIHAWLPDLRAYLFSEETNSISALMINL
jgi:hypothetical protein